MGQLISFGKNIKRQEHSKREYDLVGLLPRLSILKDEIVVIDIEEKVLKNDELLQKTIKEIAILKCIGAIPIIISNSNRKLVDFYVNERGLSDPLKTQDFIATLNETDVTDVLIKHDSGKKILKTLLSYNVMTMLFSGSEMGICFPDNIFNKNIEQFSFMTRPLHNFNETRQKQYNIDLLSEILKTDIIPIIVPTATDRHGNEYVLECSKFAMYIAKYLNAVKYVVFYTDDKSVPYGCMYGAERFTKIVKSNDFSVETLRFLNSSIEAVKNGVQCAHILDIKNVSLLEEVCSNNAEGLFLYDDTLNQL